jgi:preprotein translocase subunit SecE
MALKLTPPILTEFIQMENLQVFLKESWFEITKEVTWPAWSDLQSSATLVLIASIIFALVVGGIDFLIDNALKVLYQSF